MSKVTFIHTPTAVDFISGYPEDMEISVSFSGDCTLEQHVAAFKVFLKACEFSEGLVEERLG